MHPSAAFLLDSFSPEHRELFREGTRLFNARAFWEAHEAWEEIWKVKEDPQKRLLQGLIQAAAACHLLFTRPRLNGGLRNIEKSLRNLEHMPDECFGVRIDQLRGTLVRMHAEAVNGGQDGRGRVSEGCVPTI